MFIRQVVYLYKYAKNGLKHVNNRQKTISSFINHKIFNLLVGS